MCYSEGMKASGSISHSRSDETIEANVETAFFARFADGRVDERLTAIDVATRKDPFAVTRFDAAAQEDEPILDRADDGADRDLRIQVEDEPTCSADETLGFTLLEQAPFERAAAAWAEPVAVRVVVWMQRGHKRGAWFGQV